ncbi:MAG TPA: phosphatidylinositol mannoside acyltransferase [Acidimicrobiia bacterium]|nr:phosphatidylinositol mannoside acyltransferase [Acidimicrobiia bacterium]HIL46698.1 phosphatidylinositol mannoside acyltransferase [Acidimicrobiia bacterium]
MGVLPVAAGYRAGGVVARALPRGLGGQLARSAGRLAGRRNKDRRTMVARHLRRTMNPQLSGKELNDAIDEVFASYATYWFQSLRLPGMTPQQIQDGFTQEGYHHIEQALASGTGPIVAMPHLGGWEWAAFWMNQVAGASVNVVVEPLEPPELFEWFRQFRASLGMNVIPLGPQAGTEVMSLLRSGKSVSLLCDRNLGGAGVEVEFFGETTQLPAGPATLALRTGAAIIPTAIYIKGQGCHGVVQPPLNVERQGRLREDITRITQDLAHRLEELISAAPQQWHLLQPNWPSDHLPPDGQ